MKKQWRRTREYGFARRKEIAMKTGLRFGAGLTVLLVALSAGSLYATERTLQNWGVTSVNEVNMYSPDTVKGAAGSVNCYKSGSEYTEVYIKFDLVSAISGGHLTLGSEIIVDAKLRIWPSRIHMATDITDKYRICRLNESWSKTTLTFNSRPAFPGWTGVADGSESVNPSTNPACATAPWPWPNGVVPPGPDATNYTYPRTYVEIPLTKYVDDIIAWTTNDSTNFGWVLAPNDQTIKCLAPNKIVKNVGLT